MLKIYQIPNTEVLLAFDPEAKTVAVLEELCQIGIDWGLGESKTVAHEVRELGTVVPPQSDQAPEDPEEDEEKPVPPPPSAKKRPAKAKRWATKYDACLCCKTAEHKHVTGGLCKVCFTPTRLMATKKGIDPSTIKKGDRLPGAASGEIRTYSCNDCGETTTSALPKLDVACSHCWGVHLTEV